MHPRPRVDGVELHGNPSVEFCQAAADAYMEKPEIVRDFLQETGARISIGEYQSQTGTMPSHVFGKVFPDRLLYINQHHGTYYLSDNLAAVPEKFYATPYHVLVGESSQLDTGSVKYIFHEETWHAFFTNCKIGEDPSFIEAYDKDIQYLGGLEQAKKIAPYRTQNLDSNMGQNEAWAAVCNGNGKAKADFPHVTEYAEVYLERFDENKPFILNGTLEDSHIVTRISDTFCTGRQYHAFSVKAPAVSTPAETGWFSDLPQLSEIFGTDFPDVIHRIDIYPNFRLAAASLTLGIMLAKHKDQYVGSHFGYVMVLTFFAKNYNERNEETKMIIVKDVVDANTVCINCDSGNSCG
ncbi:MAG: hypothetical protein PHE27_04025, partial [Alphaproteobacteria bacterium]|nr:hypothetical protein [Alphaproteobacteria bacterium]